MTTNIQNWIATYLISIFAIFISCNQANAGPANQDVNRPQSLFDQLKVDIQARNVMSANVRQQYLDSMHEIMQRHKGKLTDQYRSTYLIAFAFDDSPQTEEVIKQYQDDDLARWALVYRATRAMRAQQKYQHLLHTYEQSLADCLAGRERRMSNRLFLVVSLAAALDEASSKAGDRLLEFLKAEPDSWVKFELATILIETKQLEILRQVKEYINDGKVEIRRTQFFNDSLDMIFKKRVSRLVLVHPITATPFNYARIAETSGGGKVYLNQRIDEIIGESP